jgi:hypothetical protein
MSEEFAIARVLGAKPKVTVRWLPYEATEMEVRVFEEGRPSMQQGWTGTSEQLEGYLKT